MPKPVTSPEIERLVQLLAKLPGLGPRSARRAVLHLVKNKDKLMGPLSAALNDAVVNIVECKICGNVDTLSPCTICQDVQRDPRVLVVVEDVSDLWALERASAVNGRYHVLGGTLSPLDGIGPEDLNIKGLIDRASDGEMKEIILAVNATVEGQTTAHYIMDQLSDMNLKISRLAHGVPVGGELDYLDEGTLSAAIRQRTSL